MSNHNDNGVLRDTAPDEDLACSWLSRTVGQHRSSEPAASSGGWFSVSNSCSPLASVAFIPRPRPPAVPRRLAQLELFGRWTEETGRMRSPSLGSVDLLSALFTEPDPRSRCPHRSDPSSHSLSVAFQHRVVPRLRDGASTRKPCGSGDE